MNKKRRVTDRQGANVNPSKVDELVELVWHTTNLDNYASLPQNVQASFDLMRTMPRADVQAAIEIIEGRIKALERAKFGDTVENLKQH